jgi:hypothetical protein
MPVRRPGQSSLPRELALRSASDERGHDRRSEGKSLLCRWSTRNYRPGCRGASCEPRAPRAKPLTRQPRRCVPQPTVRAGQLKFGAHRPNIGASRLERLARSIERETDRPKPFRGAANIEDDRSNGDDHRSNDEDDRSKPRGDRPKARRDRPKALACRSKPRECRSKA